MCYKGNPIRIDQLRLVFANLEGAVIKQWEEKVLCGLKLHVPMGNLADDHSNFNVGYSFACDRRNAVFQEKDRLIKAILRDPTQRARFCKPSAGGRSTIFNKPALLSWLFEYSVFHAQMLARADMISGSTIRGTELFLMHLVNIRSRTTRNLCILDKFITLMVTYTKNTSRTGHDERVPHALDGVTSDLMLQDVAIGRPFAQQIVRFCFPGNSDLIQLYEQRLFVNYLKPFDDKTLSTQIDTHLVPVLGFGLGIRGYRDISAAFQRKLYTCLADLVDGGEDQRVIAAHMTHSLGVHRNFYGPSVDSLAGPAEDVLPLFLDASTDWQVEGRQVPGQLSEIQY
jgi:hypothetical protein